MFGGMKLRVVSLFEMAHNEPWLAVSGGNLVQMFNKSRKDEYSTKAQ